MSFPNREATYYQLNKDNVATSGYANLLKYFISSLDLPPLMEIGIVNEHQPIVRLLLRMGIQPSRGEKLRSAFSGSASIIKCIRQFDSEDTFSYLNYFPFRIACQHGHLETAKLLLEWAPEALHSSNDSALLLACMEGRAFVVKFLIQQGLRNDQALPLAINEGHLQIVKIFLRLGVPDRIFELLALAGEKGHIQIYNLLSSYIHSEE